MKGQSFELEYSQNVFYDEIIQQFKWHWSRKCFVHMFQIYSVMVVKFLFITMFGRYSIISRPTMVIAECSETLLACKLNS